MVIRSDKTKELYQMKKEPRTIDVPELQFIMVDGVGDPNGPMFQKAIEAIYGLSYTIKFDLKKAGVGPEYSVYPLEGLWWLSTGPKFDIGKKEDWVWTLMVAQPDHITEGQFITAKENVRKKKPDVPVDGCRWERFKEGLCAQILHIGPYASEPETMIRLDQYLEKNGYRRCGKHHEIYMSDPRRCRPENLKTLLRHPIRHV
jgi:hypothetical protein